MKEIGRSAAVDNEKRCAVCILPESFPGITFDENGVCNLCSSYEKISPLGEDELAAVLERQKGGRYDCVVPLSGGKDSTYALYYAVKKLGLKVICVNYDSGFQSELAIRNMKRACEILDVPLVTYKADFPRRVKIVKGVLNVAKTVGVPIGICANCHSGIRSAARRAAKLHGVKVIISGTTQFERSGPNPVTGGKYLVRRLAKRSLPKILPGLMRVSALIGLERIRLGAPVFGRSYFRKDGADVKTVHLYDYIPWACMHEDIVGLLEKEVGWEHSKERVDRFDCVLHPFLNYKWFQETGISLDGYLYSDMIRMGAMSREDALSRERVIEGKLREDCSELAKLREFNDVELDWLQP
jgi:glucosamine--fructose-6-phosphate aminotransferase (isomerizing)